MPNNKTKISTLNMVEYGYSGCLESLVRNSFFGFSMLYYTKSLGLSTTSAGLATAIATLWDAVSDPIMGYITDNTRSKYGRRMPYIVVGGISMLITFFFIWYVPQPFKTSPTSIFWYLVVLNLIFRTSLTVYGVPAVALGFEICQDFEGRSKIQGIKNFMNMLANIAGPAMAWTIFFNNNSGELQATQNPQNYIAMGSVMTVASFVFLFLFVITTKKYIVDNRFKNGEIAQKRIIVGVKDFFIEVKDILMDKYPRWVLIFMFCVALGVALVSTLQMYVFDDFMQFNGNEKSIAHGGTMLGMALGSLALLFVVNKIGKKGTIYVAVLISVLCEFTLGALFLTGFLKPNQAIGYFPISLILFVVLHGGYWFGVGIMYPTAISMIADVSEINRISTGINKDGSYSAIYSLILKVSTSVSALIAGFCLTWSGFTEGANAVQTSQSMWNVCALTFVVGPMISLASLVFIMKYPVTKEFLDDMRNHHNSLITEGIK